MSYVTVMYEIRQTKLERLTYLNSPDNYVQSISEPPIGSKFTYIRVIYQIIVYVHKTAIIIFLIYLPGMRPPRDIHDIIQ